jgi:hypothetical protein
MNVFPENFLLRGVCVKPIYSCSSRLLLALKPSELWKEISSTQQQVQADLKGLGDFISLQIVDRKSEDGKRCFRYRMEFKKASVLQRFVFDDEAKLAFSESEAVEWKFAENSK